MPCVADIVRRVRSKNAGPFTATIDLFCGSVEAFNRIRGCLHESTIAEIYAVDPEEVRKFELPDLNVVKFSFPRPTIQGAAADRDMHAAQLANLLSEYPIDTGY
ncbi:MAG: DUF4387 family protein [Rhodobacteraceae bacterium]|nr:DUF4387 family protein [Paracoccaceae bacterium]